MDGGGRLNVPVWMAMPPEVHSALLSAGQGPGALLAAAAQWLELGNQYSYAAAELAQILAEVLADSWTGSSAAAYVDAHGPFLAWLEQAATDSAIAAAQHEAVAAAYTGALAAMPTMAELAANHAIHGALVTTNFFGINTIPIALNEGDYVRMWVQAADVMTAYQASADAAAAATPVPQPAPPILTPGASAESAPQFPPNWIVQIFNEILNFLADPYKYFLQFFEQFGFSPAVVLVLALIALQLYDFLWYPYYASYGLLLLPFFAPALSALSALGVLAFLLDGTLPVPAAADSGTGGSQVSAVAVVGAPPTSATAGVGSSAGNSAPQAPTATAGVGAPSSAVVSYAVPGLAPPGVSSGPRVGAKATDHARDELGTAAVGRLGAREQARRKRRSRGNAGVRGYRDEFLDATSTMTEVADEVEDELDLPAASDQGAGCVGFSGIAPVTDQPAGMVQLDLADERVTVPLLPAAWTTDLRGRS